MALLINKLFSKKKFHCKHQDICQRAFNFSQDQVRVILFRECDFRGRKLLFDSQSVQRVPVPPTATNKNDFVEISNGYGYQYLRPNADIGNFGEIVFGTVAMSFRGTSFKIHNFSCPAKLVCTQVFQSPRYPNRSRPNVSLKSNTSTHSLEKSTKLDYSNASSQASFIDHFSGHSTESDIKLSSNGSIPLDVPANNYVALKFAPSLECDSGFCGEQSYSSVSSGPSSLWDTRLEGVVQNFSCGSLYKRWLRSTSTSLDNNGCSDSSLSGAHASISEDCVVRGHRSSKLGLAIVIHLSAETEPSLEKFLLEHSALLEAMVYRARVGTESAYTRPSNFVSTMFEIVRETSQWLVDLITGPAIGTYFWHTLSLRPQIALDSGRTKGSLSEFSKTQSDTSLVKSKSTMSFSDKNRSSCGSSLDLNSVNVPTPGKSVRNNIFKSNVERLRNACFSLGNDSSPAAEIFVKELCELIEAVDVKHTNFFISTLLTAVLTNHLGWVSTVLPPSQTDKETFSNLSAPCNPLWGQLTDLYGAVGTPTKMAHTVVCGNNKLEITKILNTLTYFIRCGAIERNVLCDHTLEAPFVQEQPCQNEANLSVPKTKPNTLRMSSETESPRLKMSRTKSCLENLSQENQASDNNISDHPILDKITHLGLSVNTTHTDTLVDIKQASEQVIKIFSHNLDRVDETETVGTKPADETDVIFVLGENEALINIKKSESNDTNIPSGSKERPKDLNVGVRKAAFSCDSDSSPDSDSVRSPFSDTSPCSECEKFHRAELGTSKNPIAVHSSVDLESCDKFEVRKREDFSRSQSVPPPEKYQRKCSKNGCKIKYSGVKFNFKQYPQIVTNYMKSKNLEMSQLPFAEKALKLHKTFSASMYDCSKFDYPSCDCEAPNEEALQTPSNASELSDKSETLSKSDKKKKDPKPIYEAAEEKNAIFEHEIDTFQEKSLEGEKLMVCTEIPLPSLRIEKSILEPSGYTRSLLRGVTDKYISDMVLQGTTLPPKTWENILRRDLVLEARKPLLDQPVQESIAIIANTDTWEVQLISSHTFVVEKGTPGIQVGMSQLVANMLESLLALWKLKTPPEYCLMHLESKLREFCTRSKSLAQLLLSTEFCNMDHLTSSLQLEVNDVPLLMAIASTHTPQVTQKYGLSFQ